MNRADAMELKMKNARLTEEVICLKQVVDELKAICVRVDACLDYVKYKYQKEEK